MSDPDENATVRDAAGSAVEYESSLEGYVQNRPLTAVAVSIVIGALLAKLMF